MNNYEVQIELLASNIDKIATPVLIISGAAHLHVEDPTREEIVENFFDRLDKISIEDEAIAWIKQQEFFSIRTANGFLQTLKLHNTGKPFTLEECKKLSKGYIY